jgi:hypothetical protein
MHARVIPVWRMWCACVYRLCSVLKLRRLLAVTRLHPLCLCTGPLLLVSVCAELFMHLCADLLLMCADWLLPVHVCKGACAVLKHVAAAVFVKPSKCGVHSVHEVTSSSWCGITCTAVCY